MRLTTYTTQLGTKSKTQIDIGLVFGIQVVRYTHIYANHEVFASNYVHWCRIKWWALPTMTDDSTYHNKANLRDLIAATGPVILLKLDSNRQFFSTCDLEIWWMTPKNNTACLIYYIKLCASFQIHQWIQTGVTVRKSPIWVKFVEF